MKKEKSYKNKIWLYQKYIIEELSIYKIAKISNYHPQTIYRYLKNFNIPRRSIAEARKGKNHSEETRKKMSLSAIQRSKNPEYKEKQRLSHLGNKHSKKTKEHLSSIRKGKSCPWKKGTPPKKVRDKISATLKKRYQDKEFKEKMIKALLRGLMIRPTSYEKKIIEVCKKYSLPFRYVGNGDFIIAGKNPDFIHNNGKKLFIEVFHNYWKSKDYRKSRAMLFGQYGFKVLFLDDSDMENKNWEKICLKKISLFGG